MFGRLDLRQQQRRLLKVVERGRQRPNLFLSNFKNISASTIVGGTMLHHNPTEVGRAVVQDQIEGLSSHFIASIRNRTVVIEEYKLDARKLENGKGININFILKMRVSNNERMLKR